MRWWEVKFDMSCRVRVFAGNKEDAIRVAKNNVIQSDIIESKNFAVIEAEV